MQEGLSLHLITVPIIAANDMMRTTVATIFCNHLADITVHRKPESLSSLIILQQLSFWCPRILDLTASNTRGRAWGRCYKTRRLRCPMLLILFPKSNAYKCSTDMSVLSAKEIRPPVGNESNRSNILKNTYAQPPNRQGRVLVCGNPEAVLSFN